ncbi:MbtH family protein [Actinoallomurus bryophytorum]|uniref:MbtH protein n=1 Tax=Actinoallomurus bryophytorum TaxID=1490222 RepID=A0A543CUH4_9ACTN|nr:MbtH family NRPS accessory protein [Actinoallomurus bryophytorum]TQM00764.1 MbtH protein [Actinoallomurus bryophytorum]
MNPFEDESSTYRVLVNDERQYSLWPASIKVPAGWSVVVDGATRKVCLDYIDQHWIDMRPQSLREAMERGA